MELLELLKGHSTYYYVLVGILSVNVFISTWINISKDKVYVFVSVVTYFFLQWMLYNISIS